MMLTDDQIVALIDDLSEAFKTKDKGFHPTAVYADSVHDATIINYHYDGTFPELIIDAKAPNETQEEYDYRKNSYQSVTMGVWDKMLSSLNRIWANFSETFADDEGDESLRDYLTIEYPYETFYGFFKQIITPTKINDPNAIAVVTIKDLPVTYNDDGDEIIDQTERLQPVVKCFESEYVLGYSDKYAIVKLSEKSIIDVGGQKIREGIVMALLDETYEYRIYQIGKKHEYKFQIEEYYEHGYGSLPAWKLKGFPKIIYDEVFYKSYFKNAVPYLNKAAFLSSNLDSSEARCSFPIRTYYAEECHNSRCHGQGYWDEYDENNEAKRITCPDCNGTGKAYKFSPHTDFVQKIPGKTDPGIELPFPAFAYVSPDTAILEHNSNRIHELLRMAGMSLNMDITIDNGSKPETATKARIDLQQFHSALMNIAEELYDLYENCADVISWVRYSDRATKPTLTVNRPKEYMIKNSEMLMAEFRAASDSGLPKAAREKIYEDYVNQKFPNDELMRRIYELQRDIDPLIFDDAQKVNIKAGNTVPKWEAVQHEHFQEFALQLIEEGNDIYELTSQEFAVLMQQKAREKTLEIQPAPRTAEDIINNITNQ